jgi:hypothetical protein
MKTLFGISLLASLAATVSFANITTFDCDITRESRDGFVQGKYYFSIDDQGGQAAVLNAEVYQTNNKIPMFVDVKRNSEGAHKVKWSVRNLEVGTSNHGTGKSDFLNVTYSATLDPSSKRLRVYATVQGYSNNSSGSGRCTEVRGESLF